MPYAVYVTPADGSGEYVVSIFRSLILAESEKNRYLRCLPRNKARCAAIDPDLTLHEAFALVKDYGTPEGWDEYHKRINEE